jgi:hypothetical protein
MASVSTDETDRGDIAHMGALDCSRPSQPMCRLQPPRLFRHQTTSSSLRDALMGSSIQSTKTRDAIESRRVLWPREIAGKATDEHKSKTWNGGANGKENDVLRE